MEKTLRQDLIMNGTGNANGGSYDQVKIRGEGRVTGDLECRDMRIWGTGDLDGNLKARLLEVAGTAVFSGQVQSDIVKIYGTYNNHGDVSCKELNVKGTTSVSGNLRGEEMKIHGHLNVKGDCQAEDFVTKGVFTIGGLLNAGHIKVDLTHAESQAKEIGGEKIVVKRFGMPFKLGNLFKTARLTTETIEGDEIVLEYTKAKVVRGQNVSIGVGCEIELVEYRNNFQLAKGAKEVEHVKV